MQSDGRFAVRAKWIATVSVGDTSEVLEDGVIVVKDGIIESVCRYEEWVLEGSNINTLLLEDHLIIPGFVNCHTHMGMTLLRGYADDLDLHEWLREFVWPVESEFVCPSFVELGSKMALHEMLLTGTTTILDQYFYSPVTAALVKSVGMRIGCGEPILDFNDDMLDKKIDKAFSVVKYLTLEHNPDFVIPVINAHAAYSIPEQGLEKISGGIASLPESIINKVRVHIHLHESQHECDNYADSHCGKTAMETLIEKGLFNNRLVAAHCVCLSEIEKSLISTHQINVVHCPKSNMKLASGVCPVQSLINSGVNVALGTDGACSNNSLSMLSEMQAAALLAKSQGDATAVDCYTVLKMATLNGAIALGMDKKIGSLEVGKYADFVAIDLSAIECQPVFDPVSALVYTSGPKVNRVWVHGKELVRDGKLLVPLGLDTDEIRNMKCLLERFKRSRQIQRLSTIKDCCLSSPKINIHKTT